MYHRKEGMPCPRAMPCLPRQQLTALEQCAAYIRIQKQPAILVITDHFALGWEERRVSWKPGTASNPPLPTSTYKKAETTQCFEE